MLEELFDLPESWTWTTVSEIISDAQSGFASGKKDVPDGIPHLRMNNIGSDCRLNLDSVLTVPSDLAKARYLLDYGDILFCHTNSAKLVGKTALFNLDDSTPYAFSNHLTRLRVEQGIAPQWLWHVLATLWRERYFENRCKQWVNQATIERDTLLEAPLPLPPSQEQHRIVEKIEALFEQSRTAREALDAIPALLRQFRQAVLAAAFRGELSTRDPNDEPASVLLERILDERYRRWEDDLRAKGKDPRRYTYPEPAPPDTRGLPELPEGWCWASLDTFLELLQYGTSVKADATPETGVPVLRMGNIQDGSLRLDDLKYVHPDREDIPKYLLQRGDVLINRTNSPELVGKTAVFDADADFVFASYLIRVRVNPEWVLPNFVAYVLNSALGQNYVAKVRHQVAGQANINSENIKNIPIPFVPIREQRNIVSKIQALFAFADALEQSVEIARRGLDRLDQSILARAFRGELVPQDPNDEPASVLLERIRAEKARRAGERPSRRRNKGRK